MAKNLLINCNSCDLRKAREENYAQYEHITIHAATVMSNAHGAEFLSRMPVTLNCSNVLEMEEDVVLRCINGRAEIKSSDAPAQQMYYLTVNGTLTIGPDTQRQLERCVGICVNGSVLYPQSMTAFLGRMQVNGTVECYPDGAIVLKRTAVIDKLFALRAKPSLYWAARRLVMVDPQLDAQALRDKGVSFCSREVIAAQSKIEALLDLIDESAEITVVPDGTQVVREDVTLDPSTLRRYGSRLYVLGNVTVPAGGDCLEDMEYLYVTGDARVSPERLDALTRVMNHLSGEWIVAAPKGLTLSDKPSVTVTKWMLEQQPDGIEVADCAMVTLSDDIPKELMLQRLSICDCAVVTCGKEAEDAVSMICRNVAKISAGDHEGAPQQALFPPDTKHINACDYVL